MNADIVVTNHGSIFLFAPITDTGHRWIEDNIGDEAQYMGSALAVEHRYARDIADGMQADGLVVV